MRIADNERLKEYAEIEGRDPIEMFGIVMAAYTPRPRRDKANKQGN